MFEIVVAILGILSLAWLIFGFFLFACGEPKLLLFPIYLYKEYLRTKKEILKEDIVKLEKRRLALIQENAKLIVVAEKLSLSIKNGYQQLDLEEKIEETKKLLEHNKK